MQIYTRPIIYGALMWAVTIYAFRRGGTHEKLVSAGLVASSYLTLCAAIFDPTSFSHIEWDVLSIDVLYFVGIMLIVVRSHNYWPMWVAALQGVTIMCHFAFMLPRPFGSWIYQTSNAIWSYFIIVILAFAIRHHNRGARGECPDES